MCFSLTKPDPRNKRRLFSQDRYGIVFVHGQNVMTDTSAQLLWSSSVHLDPWSLLCLTTLVAT